MNSLKVKAEKILYGAGEKLGNQRHLKAISSGMMLILPLIVIGALFMIVANPPVNVDLVDPLTTNPILQFLLAWKSFAAANYGYLTAPFDMTMGLFGVFAAFTIAYQLAKEYKISSITAGLVSMTMFVLVCATPVVDGTISMNYLGANGLFVAIIIALLSVEIFHLVEAKNWKYQFPADVPQMVALFVNSLLPILINIIIFYGINILFVYFMGMNFPDVIMALLTPGLSAIDNIWVYIAIAVFANVLWLFGINGTSIIFPIVFTVGIANTGINAEAVVNGQDPSVIMNLQMMRYMILGGAGNTLGLVLLMMFSKSAQLKAVGRLSIVPGICGINEPVIFGGPVVFNPILAIPFLIMPVISLLLGYLVQMVGLVTPGYIIDPSFTPFFIQAYLSGLDWRNIVFVVVLVVISVVVYYPFFKVYERKLLNDAAKVNPEEELSVV